LPLVPTLAFVLREFQAIVAGTALAADDVEPTPGNGLDSVAPGTAITLVPGPCEIRPFVANHVGPDIVASPVDNVLVPEALLHITPIKYNPGGKLAANG
jgi:hypothetical protein